MTLVTVIADTLLADCMHRLQDCTQSLDLINVKDIFDCIAECITEEWVSRGTFTMLDNIQYLSIEENFWMDVVSWKRVIVSVEKRNTFNTILRDMATIMVSHIKQIEQQYVFKHLEIADITSHVVVLSMEYF